MCNGGYLLLACVSACRQMMLRVNLLQPAKQMALGRQEETPFPTVQKRNPDGFLGIGA